MKDKATLRLNFEDIFKTIIGMVPVILPGSIYMRLLFGIPEMLPLALAISSAAGK
jgi:hypothetical protein